ncbi:MULTISPECIES: Crp/Fnr family transcriptional regulator [unclassified Halomonas]|uniref:Crp/Fnr family transcriptional regulator n=1 Tax=unclassified Halomonas TaxID=2609666 RepID=UPI0020A182B1|nr:MULTISPECIES: Crp/Fnr family transcriptional regulator [unclassified Halomonas]MCP1314708.1 Crp/Fnr family transcriptional regulator [Halomonas sp. 707D7]MCP1327172.1 Crp/Fnr family transcriptional regulator [Halomonas sp. 707D4]
MGKQRSCLARHFDHYYSISKEDEELLDSLEDSPVDYKAGSLLWEVKDGAHEFCTIKSGWAYSYRHLENGDRHILDIFLPGDIIGLREFAFSQHLENVRFITDGVACRFPHKRMIDLFRQSLPLTSVMFAISSRQQAMMTERLVNLARRSARQKMAHFLNEMHARLSQTNPGLGGQFRLPLSQEQLADVLGLSPVHVSRTFTALSEDGLVYRDRHHVNIPDLAALAAEGEFDDCYLSDNVRPLLDSSE